MHEAFFPGTRGYIVQFSYIVAAALFILGLRGLTSPATARNGVRMAAVGMLVAVIGTLVSEEIVKYQWIVLGLVIGGAIGIPMALFMPMTAVPQRTAISHAFGALAVTLVGIAEFHSPDPLRLVGGNLGHLEMGALGFEVMFGALTVTGSAMAFGKLQGFITGTPITFKGQNYFNIGLFLIIVGMFVFLITTPAAGTVFYLMIGLSLLFGVLLVLPIGGADMPVVISLMNSYAGLAACATGFAIGNNVLIIAGALDGASGFFLSIVMSKAMNRSFVNVLFGGFGKPQVSGEIRSATGLSVRATTVEDAAVQLAYARSVIVVPGYGMAVAQAQHEVRQLAEQIERHGGEVKYAIHPVAGRMPGHMNVLLAEANVPYDKLLDMEEINPQFERADVALVVGANDVVNPAAKSVPSSPIYGMPILDVEKAQSIIVLKRSMNPGFSGIENELFYNPKTAMLFGDAKSSLAKLAAEVKAI